MKEKKQSGEKRYIVTYIDPKTDAETASQILSVSANNVSNGVALMETDAEITPADILHFDGVGSTVITCSEQRAEELKQDNRVLAVEEDEEVFALGTMEDYEQEVETHKEQDPYFQLAQEFFKKGYDQGKAESQNGLMEQLQKFLHGQSNETGNGNSRMATAHTAFQPRVDHPFLTPGNPFLQTAPPPQALVQAIPWNISMVKAPSAWARGLRGNGIKVAVIDTGIAPHADLGVSGGACFVPGIASFNDDNGHGTHCAGVIAARNNFIGVIGVAPAASLYAVKVLKHNPLTGGASGFTSWIIAGMTWAMQHGIKVVSMSLGAPASPMLAYRNAITQLTNAGVSVVCAAGNSFTPPTPFPWVNAPANSHPTAIAVGAVNINKLIAPFSSRGTNGAGWNPVTLVAPGVSVNSTYPFPASSYKSMSGTSMACPHVAGAIALIRQKFPMFTPAQIKFKLITSSADLGLPGNDQTYGAGLLNCDKATL